MTEIWKDIPGYEGRYMASNKGRIKALAKEISTCPKGIWTTRRLPERVLKCTATRLGYRSVEFGCGTLRERYLVHRLVAMAFLPNPLGLPHVNHIDACTSNNAVENLEWVTHQQNMAHAVKLGRMVPNVGLGDECPAHKLTEADVVQIKRRLLRGERVSHIARDYPVVSRSAIQEIKAGRSWGHVVASEAA